MTNTPTREGLPELLTLVERLLMEADAWKDWNSEHPHEQAVTTEPLLRQAAAALSQPTQGGGDSVPATATAAMIAARPSWIDAGEAEAVWDAMAAAALPRPQPEEWPPMDGAKTANEFFSPPPPSDAAQGETEQSIKADAYDMVAEALRNAGLLEAGGSVVDAVCAIVKPSQPVRVDEAMVERARAAYKAVKRYSTGDFPEGSIRSIADMNRNDDAAWTAALLAAHKGEGNG